LIEDDQTNELDLVEYAICEYKCFPNVCDQNIIDDNKISWFTQLKVSIIIMKQICLNLHFWSLGLSH